ncbi:MAG: MFS transporter [Elusimicrobiota bacterium]
MNLTPKEQLLASIGVFCGIFLAAIEGTVVATAMPTAVKSLGGISLIHFVFASYQLASTTSIPIWGKLGERWGLRSTFVLGCLIFLLGGMTCGTTHNIYQLIAARFLQGLGAGAIYPIAQSILGSIYTEVKRAKMQIYLSLIWGVASIAGPPMGAWITEALSWRWVFYLNVPAGIATLILVELGMHKLKGDDDSIHDGFDVFGSSMLLTGLLAFLGAIMVDTHGHFLLAAPWMIGLLAISVIAFCVLFVHAKNDAHPIIPMDIFKNIVFLRAAAARFFMAMAFFGSIAFMPLFCQIGLSQSVAQAGKTLTFMLLGWVTSSMIATRAYIKIPLNHLTRAGALIISGGFIYMTLRFHTLGIAGLRLMMTVLGIGMGACFSPLLLGVQSSITRKQLSVGTASLQLITNIGSMIGVAATGTILASCMRSGLNVSDPSAMMTAMNKVFFMDTLISFGALGAVWGLPPITPKN